MKIVCRYLVILSNISSCVRVLVLRELLQHSIYGDWAKYFGAKEKFEHHKEESLLLHQNHKQVTHEALLQLIYLNTYLGSVILQGTSAMLAQRHSSVFHAGVIGQGPRKPPPANQTDKQTITLNTTLLIEVIKVSYKRN